MKNRKKCRFVNLADQLVIQNEIVSSTMDSILMHDSDTTGTTEGNDWEENKKALEQMHELNGPRSELERGGKSIPKPKHFIIPKTSPNQHAN